MEGWACAPLRLRVRGVVVGGVVGVGGGGRRRRGVHHGHLDGLLGDWVVERGGFGGIDWTLHCWGMVC